MKKFVLTTLGAAVVALVGCNQDPGTDALGTHYEPYSQSSPAAGPLNTWNHMAQSIGGDNGITDPTVVVKDDQAIGTPDTVARLHGAQKIQYAALALILADLGVNMKSTTADTAGDLYSTGQGPLGVAVYPSRVAEMIIPSTSALAKEYDIFVAAAAEILKSNLAASTRCPNTTLLDTTGNFTQDGISCILGKPAKPDHLTLANQLVAQAPDQVTGQEIAIATLLAAAHTSE